MTALPKGAKATAETRDGKRVTVFRIDGVEFVSRANSGVKAIEEFIAWNRERATA